MATDRRRAETTDDARGFAPTSWVETKSFWAADTAMNGEALSRVTLRLFRVGQWLERDRRRRLAMPRKLWWACYLFWCGAVVGIELLPQLEIGPGLKLRHAGRGVVIHPSVVIGHHATVFHAVTVGVRSPTAPGVPTLGDRVKLSAGCAVLGPITIGDDAVIGANVVVVDDIPAGYAVVPARPRLIPGRDRE